MRVGLLVALLIVIAVLIGLSVYKFKLKKYGVIGVLVVASIVWVYGSNLICVNTLDAKTQEKVDEIVEICGSNTVKRSGARVLLKVNRDWVDVEDIEISGPMYITVDGARVYIGKNGLIEAIQLLEKAGLIK